MKLEQSFEVSAPPARVWEALTDVEHVTPCLPGAAITERNEDGSYNGDFKVKIGPTSAAYSGKLTVESVDDDARRATLQVAGTDKRGQGGAKATIEPSIEDAGSGVTRVNVVTDYHITGRLARFGRDGAIEEIVKQLLAEFAVNLQQQLDGAGPVAPEATAEPATPAEPVVPAAGTEPEEPPEPPEPPESPAPAEPPVPAEPPEPVEAAEPTDPVTAESDASDAEADAAAEEPPVPQAGSQGEPGDPAHASEAVGDADVSSGRASAPAGDPFAPPVPPPPPSGAAAGTAPPPPSTDVPPPADAPAQGNALVAQVKRNPVSLAGILVALLVALRLLRRRSR